jgi:hypothetical protein
MHLSRFKAKFAKARGEAQPTAKRASPKKHKLEKTSARNVKIEAEDHDGDGVSDSSMVDTPIRKMPGRKARVISFKEEMVEDEVDGDQDSGREHK